MNLKVLNQPFLKKLLQKYHKKRLEKKSNFKLIMTYIVRDEEDIIEKAIRFHHAMGVDGFIITSHNSKDKTDEILEKLKQEGLVLEIIKKTDPNHLHSIWVNEMVNLAKKKYHADWIINADADEFYYSNSLDLKKSILENKNANLLWVDSIFLFPEDRKDYLSSSYFITRPFQKFEAEKLGILNNPLYEDFIGSQGCTKVIHNTKDFISVVMGNHDAKMKNRIKIHSADIRLYHYHIRSYQGWEEKVARWKNPAFLMPQGQGEHIKNMVKLYKEGKLRSEFDKKFGPTMRNFLMEQGVLTIDPSVKNFLHYKGII